MPPLANARPLRFVAGVVAVASLAALPAPDAAAGALPVPPNVDKALSRLHDAKGPEIYAALRSLWRQWDQADPAIIEEAIASVERDPSQSPAVRAYAGVVGAYARRRRGDLDGARAKIHALGIVDRWLVVGPFDNEGKGGFARPFAPEQDLAEPLDPARAYDGKERPVRWRTTPDVYGYGWLDLGDLVRPEEKVCAYASTFVRAKSGAARPASLWIGATGAYRVFWNGAEVLSDAGYRQLDADRSAVRVDLAKGWNRLTVKLCGDDDAPMVSVRLADAKGAPDASIEQSADLSVAPEAAKNTARPEAAKNTARPEAAKNAVAPANDAKGAKGATPAAKSSGGLEGPLQAFERLASAKNPPASVLEAFARYLYATSGDDPAAHRARDLATRAATAEPTVSRCLLAGELAEDRNQRRDWVEKARALAGKGPVPTDVLLAEAQLARTGTNWRDAIPFFDEVLARDPGNVTALLGRIELYNEAGLRRTALLTLEQAVRENPMSVALLRVYAGQLRQLGRSTEAAEVEDRYAALRFDDTTYLTDRIDLAVARRDEKAADRWIDRLLAADPDSAWALSIAARSYRSLGREAQALATYQRALDLAPEDVETLRAQADLYGAKGDREEQLKLLRKILTLRPQAKDVREYVEHIEPPKPRADEAYAWDPDRFLPLRKLPAAGSNRRTLRDLQVTTVFPNGLASRFRQVVFQPLTDEAAASAREYAFGYQADTETVQLRAAKVYRADGKIDDAIESGEGPADNPAIATYTSARTFYVHFPRLNAGDVVELRYRVEDVTSRNEFADYFGEIAYLQSTEPVASAEYVLLGPKSRSFYFEASPLAGLTKTEKEDGDTRIFDFVAKDVPPIAPEPAMPPLAEVAARVHVSTYKSWDDVAKWYFGLAKDQFVPDDEVRKLVADLTKGMTDPKAKVRAIYDWVVQKTRYVALEFGIYGYKPRRCSQTFARGWGDCKDKATLIVTMLREAGIPADIVLVRSGMRGEMSPDPASLATFDHAIAYVPSMDLFLDGTAEYTGSTELPAMDRGSLALIVDDQGGGKLVHLPEAPAEATRRARSIDATLAADGSAQIDLHVEASGALAAEWRGRYHALGTRRERIARDLGGELVGFELAPGASAVEMNDLEDIEQPVKLHARGKAPALARRDGPDLSLPIGPNERLVPSYASLSSRKQDVRLRIRSTVDDELTVRLPPGATVKHAPEPSSGETPYGKWSVAVESSAGKVTVKTSLAITKTRIPPSEYAAFRSFCESVDRAFGQRLVVGGK